MREIVLKSGWDTFLFAALFLGILLIAFFRLDELLVARRRGPGQGLKPRRPPSGVDKDGHPLLSDPDGRTSHRRK